jgi:hypothetical protein
MKTTNKRITLNWSQLIGFNQVQSQHGKQAAKQAKAILAAKIGGKPAEAAVK